MLGDTCNRCGQLKDYVVGTFYNCGCKEDNSLPAEQIIAGTYVFHGYTDIAPRKLTNLSVAFRYIGPGPEIPVGHSKWFAYKLGPKWSTGPHPLYPLIYIKGPQGEYLEPIGPLSSDGARHMGAFK